MSIFTRKPKPQPIIEPTTIYNDETTAVPIIETVKPVLQEHICAACGRPGATINLIVSYFGYITLSHVYLCEPCEEARKDARKQHYVGLHRKPIAEKETLEITAIPARPARRARQGTPLADRAVNLAQEA